MAEHSSFFNGPTYDAADFAAFFASFFKNGVFAKPANGLQVRALHNDMRVTILPGVAFLDGYRYELDNSDSEFNFTVPTADGTLGRIDIIVVRRDLVNQIAKLVYIAGTPVSNPSAPALTRTSDIDEIQLCKISVTHGAIKIADSDITDTRFNDSVCGIVASAVKDISASELFAQYDSIFNAFKTDSLSSFDSWFANVQNTLDGDTAGNLLNKINNTAENLLNQINTLDSKKLDKAALLDLVFPVGAVYVSRYSTSPASLFGGTWQQIKDRFILAAGDNYKAWGKGGEAYHQLVRNELPDISLGPNNGNGFIALSYSDHGEGAVVTGGSPYYYITKASTTESLGLSRPHNTMPPYDTFYMWERISEKG